jgi:hypothetical protein
METVAVLVGGVLSLLNIGGSTLDLDIAMDRHIHNPRVIINPLARTRARIQSHSYPATDAYFQSRKRMLEPALLSPI